MLTISYALKCTIAVPAATVSFDLPILRAAGVGVVTTSGTDPVELVALIGLNAVCSTVVVAAATGVGVSQQV